MNKILSILLFACLLIGCENFYGDESLGSGYFLWKEGSYASIGYTGNNDNSSIGYTVIKENVLEAKKNENYIIVKTVMFNKDQQKNLSYWVIDKSIKLDMSLCTDQSSCDSLLLSNLTKEKDSLAFKMLLKDKNVNLSFNNWN
ncbi:hypothetical protein [Aureicoccus marinus]|uniref:hypothetical protein n=1 Tax=Aureicoccus marinus TaxID=754435 RepID=UPI0011AFDC51|nr:hypothetical protein [Aureicoccus marinus]